MAAGDAAGVATLDLIADGVEVSADAVDSIMDAAARISGVIASADLSRDDMMLALAGLEDGYISELELEDVLRVPRASVVDEAADLVVRRVETQVIERFGQFGFKPPKAGHPQRVYADLRCRSIHIDGYMVYDMRGLARVSDWVRARFLRAINQPWFFAATPSDLFISGLHYCDLGTVVRHYDRKLAAGLPEWKAAASAWKVQCKTGEGELNEEEEWIDYALGSEEEFADALQAIHKSWKAAGLLRMPKRHRKPSEPSAYEAKWMKLIERIERVNAYFAGRNFCFEHADDARNPCEASLMVVDSGDVALADRFFHLVNDGSGECPGAAMLIGEEGRAGHAVDTLLAFEATLAILEEADRLSDK